MRTDMPAEIWLDPYRWEALQEILEQEVFIPERGLRTQADFRAMGFRLKNWRVEGELLDAKDVQAGMIKNYIKTTFVNENSSDEHGCCRFAPCFMECRHQGRLQSAL